MTEIIISTSMFIVILTAYLITLKKWLKESTRRRYPHEIRQGERFKYYEYGQLKQAICARNYSDIEVIYTGRKRVEYNQISKL